MKTTKTCLTCGEVHSRQSRNWIESGGKMYEIAIPERCVFYHFDVDTYKKWYPIGTIPEDHPEKVR